ncbi:phosphohistidine phosphatase SixA [candidate division LCP-89 bacterium B3_LCP]|uniref:Phosphohistidine phosphatase SixA n=1 Tax=candidate division LCP-89 bacterium B3_LCP TaxID=2012998 RepID=A0A532V4J3_UNCL8|nr:MAG: phosphohistidine phosphatase SixA [candidate division LCP-89 bacterium B3_LCP]
MLLYLVQHGKSKPKEEDPDRSLTDEGEADVRKVASYVASKGACGTVHRILHSDKTRARQTAEILGEYLQLQGGVEAAEGLAPMDDPDIWAAKIEELTDDMMLAGHLPHLSRLASLLISGDAAQKVIDFRNGGIVCLKRDEEGAWSVVWIVAPEVV